MGQLDAGVDCSICTDRHKRASWITGGENVFPREIEEVITKHETVSEC